MKKTEPSDLLGRCGNVLSFQEYELGIYPMQKGDLIEIDDFSELCELDPSYCGYEAQGQEKSEEK